MGFFFCGNYLFFLYCGSFSQCKTVRAPRDASGTEMERRKAIQGKVHILNVTTSPGTCQCPLPLRTEESITHPKIMQNEKIHFWGAGSQVFEVYNTVMEEVIRCQLLCNDQGPQSRFAETRHRRWKSTLSL